MSYLGGVSNVRTNASASIVVADQNQPQCLAGIGGQFAEIHQLGGFFVRYEARCDGQMPVDDGIDLRLDGRHLFIGRAGGQLVVALALLALDMSVARTRATEHPHHRLVEDMLGRMHRRILLFVVLVELYFCLHRLFSSVRSLHLRHEQGSSYPADGHRLR